MYSSTYKIKYLSNLIIFLRVLFYYGARYYDPRTSVWQSPDPILETYMSGGGNGGIYNSKNLSLFGYTYNNPVNLVDPDGNEVVVLWI